MSEWEFVSRLAEDTRCGLLLDVNNVYVSSFNHDQSPAAFIEAIPHDRIVQFHLAGHSNYTTHIIDTHDGQVIDPVWALYSLAHRLTGGVSTLLEWDANIPPFPVLHDEVLKAKRFMKRALPDVKSAAASHGNAPSYAGAGAVPHPLHYVAAEVE